MTFLSSCVEYAQKVGFMGFREEFKKAGKGWGKEFKRQIFGKKKKGGNSKGAQRVVINYHFYKGEKPKKR